ncbi:MAG: NAD(P)-dependent alcohol dehydrogenase [Bacteroidota bacterium]
MKAAIRRKYGSPDLISIADITRPTPKSNEVLLKVHATTVNRTDCAILTASYLIMRLYLGLIRPRQIILGTDVAGEVVEIGEGVTEYKVGDRVFGFRDEGLGSQAEYVAISNERIFRIPEEITYAQAAASLEAAHCAYGFLQKIKLEDGQSVLVNGATGAIGSALLQMIRQHDIHITATCRVQHFDLVKQLGADQIYDYEQEDVMKKGGQYDYVFDAVGKRTFGSSQPVMKSKSAYISSELGLYGQNIFYALKTAKSTTKKVIFPLPEITSNSIPYIIDLLERGLFQPVIDRHYSLNQVRKAYAYVMSGQKVGNVVLAVSSDV